MFQRSRLNIISQLKLNKIRGGSGLDMPLVTTYQDALNLIGVKYDRVKYSLRKLESEGRTEKSICYAINKARDKLVKFKYDARFYNIFENEIKKWSWAKNDKRWEEYNKRKKEEKEAELRQLKIHNELVAEAERKRIGYIYIIQALNGGPVKIGHTKNVKNRLSSLQTGYPETLTILACVAGDIKQEQKLHEKYIEYRLRGEWYNQDILNVEEIANMMSSK